MIAFLMAASAAMGPGGGGAGGAGAPWETAAWTAFREAWDTARATRSVEAIDARLGRVAEIERSLATVLPGHARPLVAVLEARLKSWRTVLTASPGKPPRPDWPALLRGGMGRLDLAHAALLEMRRLGWKDPWIETEFAPDVALLAQGVASEAGVVEREYPKEKRLVRDARALLDRVRPALPPPPSR